MQPEIFPWLLSSPEPWTRLHALTDLQGQPPDAPAVRAARSEMLAHPQVRQLLITAATWPGPPLKRHNDSSHPLHRLTTLADFGLQAGDPGLDTMIDAVLALQSEQGSFQILTNVAPAYGGTGQDLRAWMACDAPSVLYALLSFGLGKERSVQRAVDHLIALAQSNGWGCAVCPELGKMRGPGRRGDPCPIATLLALKALALLPGTQDLPAAQTGVETLLDLWQRRTQTKPYLFGMGTDFRKLKYPYVWYDLLHVLEVLSRYPAARRDARYVEMRTVLATQAAPDGRFTAGSMYLPWKGWSFADKKQPSPWLTLLAWRCLER